jgi:hypothetical protein
MKAAVDKVKRGKGRVVNTRFAAMVSHYLFEPELCNVASGWEKGVVEKNVQDSRRRIWQDAQGERFGSFADLKPYRWPWSWYWNPTVSPIALPLPKHESKNAKNQNNPPQRRLNPKTTIQLSTAPVQFRGQNP